MQGQPHPGWRQERPAHPYQQRAQGRRYHDPGPAGPGFGGPGHDDPGIGDRGFDPGFGGPGYDDPGFDGDPSFGGPGGSGRERRPRARRQPRPRSQDRRSRDPRTPDPRTRDPRTRDPRTPDPRTPDPRTRDPRDRRGSARDPRGGTRRGGPPGNTPPGNGQRPRRRTPLWAKLTVITGAVLMLLSGTSLAGYEVLSNRYTSNVQQENLLGEAAVDPGQELDGPLNLLMLGLDEQGEGARSDTIIVLHIPSTHDQAYLLSVPRDLWVTVPGYWDMKLTDAFNAGYESSGGEWGAGAQLVASVLSDLTGLRFNGAAIVNFRGFEKIIDAIGGIEFCFDTAAYSEHLVRVNGEVMGIGKAKREGYWDYEQITYQEECRDNVAGWEALDYARQRKTLASGEGDYGRARHQQQLLEAMMKQVASTDVTTNLGTLDSLILAAGEALIVDTNNVEMVDFLFTLRNMRPGDLTSLQTNQGEFNSDLIGDQSVERLTPESLEMFRAAANDTMGQFIVDHPDFLNPA